MESAEVDPVTSSPRVEFIALDEGLTEELKGEYGSKGGVSRWPVESHIDLDICTA